jgi:hypothetical protein
MPYQLFMKIILFLFLLLYYPYSIQAQQLFLIPKAGISLSNLAGAGSIAMENRSSLGVMAGMSLEMGLLKDNRWAFQPEIAWVQKGCHLVQTEYAFNLGVRDESFRISYLEIPLLVKRTFGKANWQWFLNAGPSLGIGLSGKHIYKENPDFFWLGEEWDIVFSDGRRLDTRLSPRFDVALLAGAGLSYNTGTVKIILEGRYGLGLSTVRVTGGEPTYLIPSHHRFLLLNVGVAVPLHKND